ncbi:hypothetical protein D3C72_1463280 [compost metagenome]
MRGSHRAHVEALAVGSLAAMEALAVPGGDAALLVRADVGTQAFQRTAAAAAFVRVIAEQVPAAILRVARRLVVGVGAIAFAGLAGVLRRARGHCAGGAGAGRVVALWGRGTSGQHQGTCGACPELGQPLPALGEGGDT